MLVVTVNLPRDSSDDVEYLIGKEIELWIIEHMPRIGPTHIVVCPVEEQYIVNVFKHRVKFNIKAYPKSALLAQFAVTTA